MTIDVSGKVTLPPASTVAMEGFVDSACLATPPVGESASRKRDGCGLMGWRDSPCLDNPARPGEDPGQPQLCQVEAALTLYLGCRGDRQQATEVLPRDSKNSMPRNACVLYPPSRASTCLSARELEQHERWVAAVKKRVPGPILLRIDLHNRTREGATPPYLVKWAEAGVGDACLPLYDITVERLPLPIIPPGTTVTVWLDLDTSSGLAFEVVGEFYPRSACGNRIEMETGRDCEPLCD